MATVTTISSRQARRHARASLPATPCRTLELLLAEGTVPMYYQSVKYNIPVAVWLPERYPLAPPLVYVVPTPDMVIKPRHSFVDASGGRWGQKGQHGRCQAKLRGSQLQDGGLAASLQLSRVWLCCHVVPPPCVDLQC